MQKKTTPPQDKQADMKPTKPAAQQVTNPSEKLANLLRKEGLLMAKAHKTQAELKTVQSAIQQLWEARKTQGEEAFPE